ncbi:MAG: U-box domain-containing protein [Candidatus Berkiellales bacterium]
MSNWLLAYGLALIAADQGEDTMIKKALQAAGLFVLGGIALYYCPQAFAWATDELAKLAALQTVDPVLIGLLKLTAAALYGTGYAAGVIALGVALYHTVHLLIAAYQNYQTLISVTDDDLNSDLDSDANSSPGHSSFPPVLDVSSSTNLMPPPPRRAPKRPAARELFFPKQADEEDMPDHLQCSITLSPITKATLTPRGHTYDDAAIRKWVAEKGTSPQTRDPVSVKQLIPNRALQDEIDRRNKEMEKKKAEKAEEEKKKIEARKKARRASARR